MVREYDTALPLASSPDYCGQVLDRAPRLFVMSRSPVGSTFLMG